MSRTDHMQQKLFEAVHTLVDVGTIQERLAGAAMSLAVVVPRPEEGHPELEPQFEAVMKRLRGASGPEGLAVTIGRFTDVECSEIAHEILSLFCRASELARDPTGFPDLQIRQSKEG